MVLWIGAAIPSTAQVFQTSYISANPDDVKSLQKDYGNRGYIIAANSTQQNDKFVHLLRFAPNGTLKSQKILSWGNTTTLGGIVPNEQGYAVTAHLGFVTRTVFAQLDTLGNVIWEKFIGWDYEVPHRLFAQTNRSLVSFVDVDGLSEPYYVQTVDSLDNQLSSYAIYRTLDPRRFRLDKVIQVADNEYFIICQQPQTMALPIIYIKNNAVLWATEFRFAPSRDRFDITDLQKTPDGYILIFGNIHDGVSGSLRSNAFIFKMTSLGSLWWGKEYPGIPYLSAGAATNDKILAGSGDSNKNIALFYQFDAQGNPEWAKSYTNGGGDHIQHILPINNPKGYLLSGRARTLYASGGYADVLFIKTDSSGFAGCATETLPITTSTNLFLSRSGLNARVEPLAININPSTARQNRVQPLTALKRCLCLDSTDAPTLQRISSDTICLNQNYLLRGVSNGDSFRVKLPNNLLWSYNPTFNLYPFDLGSSNPVPIRFSAFKRATGCETSELFNATLWNCTPNATIEVKNGALLNVYPNPSTGRLVVNTKLMNLNPVQLTVYNLLGQAVFRREMVPVDSDFETTLQLENQTGIYYLELRTANMLVSKMVLLKRD